MAEENQVVEVVDEVVKEEIKSVCGADNCIAQEGEAQILDLLTAAVGYDVFAQVEGCECESNLERIKIREEIHLNPDVDTTKADQAGNPEFDPEVEKVEE